MADLAGPLPFGSGIWSVWGYVGEERDVNPAGTKLPAPGAPPLQAEVELYRTDDEEEARQLVREGGFVKGGVFYATSRISNAQAAQHKRAVESQTGYMRPSETPKKDSF